MPRQLRGFLSSQNFLFVWNPRGQGLELPVRTFGKLAPDIGSIKIRSDYVRLIYIFKAKILVCSFSELKCS
jgi:hypothetical protein